MTDHPITGLSDQRYFHLALLVPDKSSFPVNWIWENVQKDAEIGPGRYRKTTFQGGAFDFRVLQESNLFAGSIAAKEALAVSKTECAYDIFVCASGGMFILGTGYAALTRLVFARLMRRHLLSRASFLKPTLGSIVASFRVPMSDSKLPIKFTVTGFSASLSGKNLKSLRLGGNDVFGSGLVEQIERWLGSRDRGEVPNVTRGDQSSPASSFEYEALRLKVTDSLTGAAASLSLVRDGSYKVWLRKSAVNIPNVAKAVSVLQSLELLEATKEQPKWSEELDL